MKTDPFDELEAQLRGRVREQLAGGGAVGGRRRRRWRPTPLLAIAAIGLTLTGGAVAATSLTRPGDRERGVKLAHRAIRDVVRQPACALSQPPKEPSLAYSDAAVLPAVLRAVPWIAEAPTGKEATRARFFVRTWQPTAPVIRGTEHVIDMGRGRYVFVYVTQGRGWFGALQDPVACAVLRRERVQVLAADRPGVLRAALAELARAPDVAVGTQELSVNTTYGECHPTARRCGGGGTGMTFWSDAEAPPRDVPAGQLASIGGRYTGLGGPRADHLTIAAKYPERLDGVPRKVRLRRGFWVVDLPRGTGPVRVSERAADGTVLRVIPLRGRY